MTTDFRALCAELLSELEHATHDEYQQDVKGRARTALAEPQPEPPTECEVAKLVAWLLGGGEDAAANGWDHQARQFGRAAELLQRLQPEPPTDEELDGLFTEIDQSGEPESWRAYARAVLARWGNHLESPDSSPTPIPVSERLPGPDDCNADGRCWLGGEMFAPGDPTWVLGFPIWAQRFPKIHRYWLPAHALPLIGEDISGKG